MTSPQELNIAVLRIEGTNCEDEAAAAFSQLGCNTEQVHLKQLLAEAQPHRQLADYDALFIPGGFSAGDYVRAGAIFAARLRAGLRAPLDEYINSGAPVLGVCNGFQILVETGALPGTPDGLSEGPQAVLHTCRVCEVKYSPQVTSNHLNSTAFAVLMADEEEVRDPTPGDINSRLLERLVDSDTVAAKRLEPTACIAVGFPKGKTATFDGTGGDNFGGLNRGAQLILNGGAGRLAGNSMLAGEIIVNGSAGSGAGHGLAGGTLVVQGSVRGSAAAGMLDGELLVAGDVDGSLGTGMQGGTVAVAGDVSGDVARYMAGGKLFIAGNFTPPEAGAKPAAPSERKIVQKLLQEHGIDPHGLEFQSVTARSRPV